MERLSIRMATRNTRNYNLEDSITSLKSLVVDTPEITSQSPTNPISLPMNAVWSRLKLPSLPRSMLKLFAIRKTNSQMEAKR